ncbi:MAG: urate hydroxylase PuuD, partial [Myxococcaceae bacterium]
MPAHVQEWLNLLVRWVHVIAAIMWIGDSFLFMWLDSHLSKPLRQREGDVVGELWMTHSGGFYEVVKRKSLGRDELPPRLYWFKWESYTTWASGFLLLIIVYQLNGAALLVDPAVSSLTHGQAVALSLAILPAAFGVYELLWRTPLASNQRAFGVVGLGLITGLAWGLTQVFSARGAFLMVGATLGTVMAANVFFRIIPAQKHMLAMTREGKPVDASYGLRAKGRSIQNHYLTLPVLFTMVSNHFPSTYGHPLPWLVLALLVVFGAGLKYVMNHRTNTHPVAAGGTVLALAAVLYIARPVSSADAAALAYNDQPQVSFATVKAILDARCTTCHAARPSSPMFPAPPLGIALETPADIRRHAERVFIRATATKTMPLANLTGMTDEERALLGAWFAQGADVNASGPV